MTDLATNMEQEEMFELFEAAIAQIKAQGGNYEDIVDVLHAITYSLLEDE